MTEIEKLLLKWCRNKTAVRSNKFGFQVPVMRRLADGKVAIIEMGIGAERRLVCDTWEQIAEKLEIKQKGG